MDLSCPVSWSDLSQRQLLKIYSFMAMNLTSDEVKLHAFLYLTGCKVIGRVPPKPGAKERFGSFLLRVGKKVVRVSSIQIAECLPVLDYLDELHTVPVRLDSWRGRKALDPLLQGVPFEKFIIVENLYQGYLSTKQDEFLDQIADVLYPRKFWRRLIPDYSFNRQAFRLNVFFWVASVKKFLADAFPDFFKPAAAEGDNLLGASGDLGRQLQDSMNAQIRALTKGDVTKEAEVLSLDTWRALTELNAQAREYAELKARSK